MTNTTDPSDIERLVYRLGSLNEESRFFLLSVLAHKSNTMTKCEVLFRNPSKNDNLYVATISEIETGSILLALISPLGADYIRVTTKLSVNNLYLIFKEVSAIDDYEFRILPKIWTDKSKIPSERKVLLNV